MKPKQKCEECGKIVRKCNLRENKLTKKLMCKCCFKKIGENKYYTPNKNNRITKYYITDNEKRVLFKNLVSEGLSRKEANFRINSSCKGLRTIRKKKKKEEKEKRIREILERKEKECKKEAFLGGLK